MKRVYISGALASAKNLQSARILYEAMALACEEAGAVAYLPHKATDPELNSELSDEYVATRDLEELSRCDHIVASLSDPSTGMGAELAIAQHQGKKNSSRAVRGNEREPSRKS